MNEHLALRALSPQTKVLIIVSEFEARKMPIFQLRLVLSAIVSSDDEKKQILETVDAELRAAGHPVDQITNFLNDLLAAAPVKASDQPMTTATRRLRSPFAMGFDAGEAPPAPQDAPRVGGFVNAAPTAPAHNQDVGVKSQTVVGQSPLKRAPFGPPIPSPPPNMPRAPLTDMVPANTAPPPDMRMPVGTKTIARHDIVFSGNTAASGGTVVSANRPVVLLADDDKRIRMVFRLRLEDAGFNVLECADGTEAWEKIQATSNLAAVALDMKMPGMHGLEVLTKMADRHMSVPVVVCSAYDQLESEFVVQKYPSLRYLVKPIAPEVMVNTIKELTGRIAKQSNF